MPPLTELEHRVHTCSLCKEGDLKEVVKYYPIYSFGNPYGKELLVVGINPSTREYKDNYVSSSQDPENRHNSQRNYFQQGPYTFFTKLEKFFHGEAKTALSWVKTPWEKVGFTDLVKCPTRYRWTKIKPQFRRLIKKNCQQYLVEQLELIKQKATLAYGAPVCRWFYPGYTEDDDAYTTMKNKPIILVPQSHRSHPKMIIQSVQKQIAKLLIK